MPPHHPPLRLHINTHVSLSMNAAAQSVRYARTQVVAFVILTKEIEQDLRVAGGWKGRAASGQPQPTASPRR